MSFKIYIVTNFGIKDLKNFCKKITLVDKFFKNQPVDKLYHLSITNF